MGRSGDDAVHTIPHKMKMHWQNQLKILVMVLDIGIRYKKIDVILVQCHFKGVMVFYTAWLTALPLWCWYCCLCAIVTEMLVTWWPCNKQCLANKSITLLLCKQQQITKSQIQIFKKNSGALGLSDESKAVVMLGAATILCTWHLQSVVE